MKCKWIKKKGQIVGALTSSGEKSQLFEDLNKNFDLEKTIELYAVSQSDEFQEIFGEQVSAETVVKYVADKNKTTETLTKEQLVDLKDFNNFDRQKLLEAFYDKNGLFNPNQEKLVKSGLYTQYEAGTIVDDIELQQTIKDSLERLKNTSEEELILPVIGEVTKLNEFNSFGKLVTIIPQKEQTNLNVSKEAIKTFYDELLIIDKQHDSGDLDWEDYEIERQKLLMNSLQDYFGGKYFDLAGRSVRIADHKQGTVYHSSSDFSFVIKRASSSTGTDFTISYNEDIKDAINFILKTVGIEDVSQKQAEVFVEVDVDGTSVIRPKRNTETELILPITAKQTSNQKVSDLNDIPLNVLQRNQEQTIEVLDQIENELIKDSIDVIGLSQMPIDEKLKEFITVLDTFIKAPTKENTRQFAEKSDEYFNRDLSLRKEVIKADENREYVKLETNLSEEEVYNQQGLIKLDDNTYIKTAKEDLATLYENLRTYTEKYSGTLEEHVQEQIKGYNFENAEIAEAVVLYKMYFGVVNDSTNEAVNDATNFTGNYNYLTEEFPSDFYSKFLAEKKKNSKLFRDFYSNFEINEKGIKLLNTDDVTLRTVKIYADENLKNYSIISKQMPNLKEDDENYQTSPRDEAVNNFKTITEFTGQMFRVNDQEIILKNSAENFIRIGNQIYESVNKKGDLTLYSALETSLDYLKVNIAAPQTKTDINDFMYLENSPEKFKKYKKKETPQELDC